MAPDEHYAYSSARHSMSTTVSGAVVCIDEEDGARSSSACMAKMIVEMSYISLGQLLIV